MTNESKFKVGYEVVFANQECVVTYVYKCSLCPSPYLYDLACGGVETRTAYEKDLKSKKEQETKALRPIKEVEKMPGIKNVVFRPDKRRVTIVFDGFDTRATCKEGEEYRPLLGFLIAYFKAVKKLQGWNSKMVQRYFEGVLYYLPPEEQEAYLKAVYFENAKPTFKQALELFDDVEAYWEKRL